LKKIPFATMGPFPIGRASEPIESRELKRFWREVEAEHEGLSGAIGVYVLMIGSQNAFRPVYVGKAEHGFQARLIPGHDAFRKVRNEYKDESISLLLLARVTPGRGGFVRKREKGESLKSIQDLEVLIIRDFVTKGFDLLNSKEKQFFEALVVPGYLHDEGTAESAGAACFRKLLQGKARRL
jgi:hypothetical protein